MECMNTATKGNNASYAAWLHRCEESLEARKKELDAREALIDKRQAAVLRGLSVESDKNFALLEARKAEIEAKAVENDAKIKQIGAELDKRDAELKARATELDKRDAELAVELDKRDAAGAEVTEEILSGRKRPREVDFSRVDEATEQLKKIYGSAELDDETKKELKQLVLAMLERSD